MRSHKQVEAGTAREREKRGESSRARERGRVAYVHLGGLRRVPNYFDSHRFGSRCRLHRRRRVVCSVLQVKSD